MKNLTLENLTKVCGGVYFGPSDKLEQEVSSITTDSRKAEGFDPGTSIPSAKYRAGPQIGLPLLPAASSTPPLQPAGLLPRTFAAEPSVQNIAATPH